MDSHVKFRQLGIQDFDPDKRGHFKRKRVVINKSTLGCSACKIKKVKCDEEKPTCRRCTRNGRSCLYNEAFLNKESGSSSTISEPSGPDSSYSCLVQHLEMFWEYIFHIPRTDDMMSLFRTDDLVCTVLLAISACHIRESGAHKHDIAGYSYQYKAFHMYRSSLDSFDSSQDISSAKRLLVAGLLLNILTFALPEIESDHDDKSCIGKSCMYSQDENRFGWIAMHYGFRRLLLTTAPYQGEIMAYLSLVFMGTLNMTGHVPRLFLSSDAIPAHWKESFQITYETSTTGCESSNPFLVPLSYLAKLRLVEPTRENSFLFLSFLMKIDSKFQDFLLAKDLKAIWILGYWSGLMCSLPKIWWCTGRATREYTGICAWFREEIVAKTKVPSIQWQVIINELFQMWGGGETHHGGFQSRA